MDVIRERLEREYDLDLIVTAPSVVYRVEKGEGEKKKEIIVDVSFHDAFYVCTTIMMRQCS